jgi:periplasmic protein TonB
MLALRLPLATSWGFLLTLVMFWALWSMINAPIDIDRIEAPIIDFTPKIADTPPTVKDPNRIKPELEIPTVSRPGPIGVPTEEPPSVRNGYQQPPIIRTGSGPAIEPTGGGIDQDALPVVRIEPDYPAAAERREIEGWVRVQFSVTRSGRVTDVVVVDANPRGVFDAASIEAVRRWLYNPKVEDGVAVERVGLQTVFVFEMPD